VNPQRWQWTAADPDREKVHKIKRTLGLHRLTASRLVELGHDTPEAASLFLSGTTADLADPFTMSGMHEAVDRLVTAATRGEAVLVYGDYDADGITSAALLILFLRTLGLNPSCHLPSRLEEGYGLHTGILEEYAASGGRLVITVDCGSNDSEARERAKELGLDLVITDHHQVLPGNRDGCTFVNPRQPGCAYPDRDLAGVGVAYALVRALAAKLKLPPGVTGEYLDLAALGTVADVAQLTGENRILVRHGLRALAERPRPGLLALAGRAGLDLTAPVTARQVAFTLAPRLNAPGRLGNACPSLELLLTACTEKAACLAAELDAANRRRQQVEAAILEAAREQAAGRRDDPGLVLWHEDWHPGVVGIVAGKLAGEMARPVVLVSLYGGEGRGSGRSVAGFDLLSCLSECAPYLVRFGGHREAAGVTVEPSLLADFRDAFCRSLAGAADTYIKPPVATARVSLAELSLELARELSLLEPFGYGNQEPVFLADGVEVVSSRLVGSNGNHLQLRLRQDAASNSAIFFGAGANGPGFSGGGEVINCAFTLRENIWRERSYLSLHIRDLYQSNDGEPPGLLDRRGNGDRDGYLRRLAGAKRVLVWTNTRAAAGELSQLPGVAVSHLGWPAPSGEYGALVFYHLPYDRAAVERLLSALDNGLPPVHLLYGPADLDLNARIFAAGIPDADLLARLVPHLRESPADTPERLQRHVPFPLTRKVLARAAKILQEVEEIGDTVPAGLARSHTFREGQKLLADFHSYQDFWLTAGAADLSRYFREHLTLPEETAQDESGTA
jgi:single-stranded-DNA-specific exonuclease